MKLAQLTACLYGSQLFNINPDQEIVGLTNDSRKVQENYCFIAIRGEHFDGHQALETVIHQGARLLVVEELNLDPAQFPDVSFVRVKSTDRAQGILANAFYHEPSTQMRVVAVTGTNGKTTTSSMISTLLEALGHRTGLIGTLHYKIADQYLPAINTTPNSLALQDMYQQMLEAGCEDVVIEASSHALSLGRLAYTDVSCAIYTNLSREHLDYHKTMDNYAWAKSLLFSQLGQRFDQERPKLAIVNLDDSYTDLMVEATSAELVTYSLDNPQADVWAEGIASQGNQLTFKLHYQGQILDFSLPMLGRYNVANFMAAFLCLVVYYGYSPDQVRQASNAFSGVSGRMQLIDEGQDFKVILDFAHTTEALENVLGELSQQDYQRLIIVMGHSGGNRDSAARPAIGDILFKYADHLILTTDNPRFEPFDKIVAEMVGNHQEEYTAIYDRQEAIYHAFDLAEPGDLVLLAGKAGENYQVVGDDYLPYNEEEVARSYFKRKSEV